MSAAGLDKGRLERLHEAMAVHVERGTVPGLVSLVARRGEVHVDAIGTTEPGGGRPVTFDTIFRISSMTKPVTAVATMLLVEEGKLRLDEPVDRLLPELADRRVLRDPTGPVEDTVPAARPITVRDLLTFRLGFGMFLTPEPAPIHAAIAEAGFTPGPPRPQADPAPDEWLRRFATLPLLYQPGERWLYHTGADLLGILVARAAGQPFDAVLRERVFEPLGMVDTGFFVPEEKRDRFTAAYYTNPNSGEVLPFDPVDGEWATPPAFPGGGAGLVSTVADMLAFGEMLRHGGRHDGGRLLARPTVGTMTTNHLDPAQLGADPILWGGRGWGFGMSVVTRRTAPSETPGKFGWDGGLGTSWAVDPAEELVTMLFTPVAWPSPTPPAIFVDFATLAYAAIDD
jgi:CubicO group peptidase (beta-lactamase class C family)